MPLDEDQLRYLLMNLVGIRAPITAAAILQLVAELRVAGILNDDAIQRIKEAMAHAAFQACPSHANKFEFEAEIGLKLDRLFNVEALTVTKQPDLSH